MVHWLLFIRANAAALGRGLLVGAGRARGASERTGPTSKLTSLAQERRESLMTMGNPIFFDRRTPGGTV
jgi:hypothetical protein